MSTKLEKQWDEYFFFGGPIPHLDTIVVPYPFNFTPIKVEYIPSEESIEVICR